MFPGLVFTSQKFLPFLRFFVSHTGPASKWARPPTSKYHVGAAGIGSSGRIFIGVNVELPGLPINNSIHAEQFLITNAWLNGERALTAVAVSAAPCGHCRQFFCELSGADAIQFIFGPPGAPPRSLDELLPLRFGPSDLVVEGSEPLLLDHRHNQLVLRDEPCSCSGAPATPALIDEALRGANRAHALYTRCPSGVAIQLRSGRVFSGGCIESAAFNPTLPALQAAIVAAIADRALASFGDIVGCALVETEGAAVRAESTLRHLLGVLAPGVQLVVAVAVPAQANGSGAVPKCSSPRAHL